MPKRANVVVTGASAGVGRATVRAFAEGGADVALLARGVDGLAAAAREVEECGGRALTLPVDIANAEEVEGAAETVERALGPIDIWINNAMVSVFSPVREMRPEEYERVTQVTYLGAVYGTLAALRRMMPRDQGTIVQVGSALSYRAIPLQSAYCAAKHALRGFTDALRCELMHERSKVRLTMVHLPALNTPQFDWSKSRMSRRAQPVPPIYQPDVAARAIVWAASHPRRELFVGWSTLKAVFGNKIAPGFADRRLAQMGYESQLTSELEDPERPNNLFSPVPGDFGAHGRFDARARAHTTQSWITRHRRWWVGGGLGAAAAAALLVARRS